MLGAEVLLRTIASAGVDVCFANPGTSEMHLVAALDHVPSIRPVLVLAEGVASGAADGWARMTGRPASTLLHLGPGLSNALANLHNARRSGSPMVNIVGEHASFHLPNDPPLASDIASLARPVSAWVDRVAGAGDMARAGAESVRRAMGPPSGIATLIVPADASWDETEYHEVQLANAQPAGFCSDRVDAAARAMRSGAHCVLLIGNPAMNERGARAASRAANATGARLFCTTFTARAQRGAGHALVERLPYFPELVAQLLAGARHLVLAGATAPVAFFAAPGAPRALVPEGCEVHRLAQPDEDVMGALEALADALGAGADTETRASNAPPPLPTGRLDPAAVAAALGALMPEQAIIADEAVTTRFPSLAATTGAAPHDWLCQTGGSLGLGMPIALGAALACPDRRVINLQADGSAMYAPQALWSFAREGLNVTTILLKNRRYRILDLEMERLKLTASGERTRGLFDLTHPEIDFVALARSMGVSADRATTAEELVAAMQGAFADEGPRLIEAVLATE